MGLIGPGWVRPVNFALLIIYEEVLPFSTNHFKSFVYFSRSKLLKKFFQTIFDEVIEDFSLCTLSQFSLTTSETELVYYHEKVGARIASRFAKTD